MTISDARLPFPMPRPNKLLVLAAIGGALLLGCRASSAEPTTTALASTLAEPTSPATTTPPPTMTTTSLEEDLGREQIAVVEAMVAVRNSGDFDAWRAFFPAERPVIWAGTVEDESELDWQRSFMAANEVWTITEECQWSSHTVSCPMTLVNEFFGPAGLFYRTTVDFRVDDQGVITSFGTNSWEIAGEPDEYSAAFDGWFAEAHPDVRAGFAPPVEGEDSLPNSEDMPAALEYVHEFIAQSDTYPLGALRVAGEYFEAFNNGDEDAAAALLVPDVAASDSWGSIDVFGELAWFTAGGAKYRSVTCEISPEQPANGDSVTCNHETLDAIALAVEAPPVPTKTSFVVTESGITEIHFAYGSPDFTHVGFPFRDWLVSNRPDATCVAWYAGDDSCQEATTLEEQRVEGRLVARYGKEWAAYLEENECTYLDGC